MPNPGHPERMALRGMKVADQEMTEIAGRESYTSNNNEIEDPPIQVPENRITDEEFTNLFPNVEWPDTYAFREFRDPTSQTQYQPPIVYCKLGNCNESFLCSGRRDIIRHLESNTHTELGESLERQFDGKVSCTWRMNDLFMKFNLLFDIEIPPLECGEKLYFEEYSDHILKKHLPQALDWKSPIDKMLEDVHSRMASLGITLDTEERV